MWKPDLGSMGNEMKDGQSGIDSSVWMPTSQW